MVFFPLAYTSLQKKSSHIPCPFLAKWAYFINVRVWYMLTLSLAIFRRAQGNASIGSDTTCKSLQQITEARGQLRGSFSTNSSTSRSDLCARRGAHNLTLNSGWYSVVVDRHDRRQNSRTAHDRMDEPPRCFNFEAIFWPSVHDQIAEPHLNSLLGFPEVVY